MSTTRAPNGEKAPQSPPQSPLKMSEIKPEFFTKVVRKHAGRAKERLLQNLGKADRTTDEVFDDYVHNFTRQQNQAARLQKEMSNYVRCARAMQAASKSLLDTIYDMYEPEWTDREKLSEQAQALETLWADYCHKLSEQVLEPLNTYASQFPEVRRKVEKRGRKLVDYDGHRHNYEAMQNTKKRDDVKIARQRELLDEARHTFEAMNSELYDELPALYDSRIPFLVSNLQTLFMAEHGFQSDAAKVALDVQLELEAVMDRLQKESSSGKYTTRRNAPKSPKSPTAPAPASPTEDTQPAAHTTAEPGSVGPPAKPPRTPEIEGSTGEPPAETETAAASDVQPSPPPAVGGVYPGLPSVPETEATPSPSPETNTVPSLSPEANTDPSASPAADTAADPDGSIDRNKTAKDELQRPYEEIAYNKENGDTNGDLPAGAALPVNGAASGAASKVRPEELYDIPVGATTDNLPPGVLYRVKAAYKYQAEDADELSFEVGEILQVIEYDDAEEMEEGWLMGIKEPSGQKGLFPANFTRPI